MFNVRYIPTQFRRLGLGVAVAALALTSVISPVAAAEKSPETGPTMPKPDGGASIAIPQKSDLQVTARGKEQKGTTTYYYFMIKNLGPAAASNIHAYKEAHTHAIIGNGAALVGQQSWTLNLASGQSVPVTVTCTPQTGHYCHHANALVWLDTNADPNFSNDVATIY